MKTGFLALTALATLSTAIPTFNASADDFGSLSKRAPAAVFTKCTKPNTVALTFDDGPYQWHEEVAQMLNQAGAKGTFFVNGNNYDCIYDNSVASQLLQSFQEGHQIASHTWSHPHMTQISSSQLSGELSKIDTALQKILGVKSAFLRPPYGEYNDAVRNAVGNNGQSIVTWDFDSGDSVGATAAQSKASYDSVFAQKPSNLLALNHETVDSTVHDVLPYVLSKYGNSGYDFVTVAECLGMSAYTSQGSPGTRDSSWQC